MRRALDELWLIDLEGDQRAARASANVFPIRTPVAIALGVRYGDGCEAVPASVHYTRIEGAATHKLSLLGRLEKLSDLTWQPVPSGWQGPLHAVSCSEYWRWPGLTDLFPWQLSGVQFKRTWPIGSTSEVLRERWRRLLTLPDGERRAAFGATRDRDVDSSPPDLLDAETRLAPLAGLAPDARHVEPVRYAYRSLRPPLGLARCTPGRLHAATFVACGGPAPGVSDQHADQRARARASGRGDALRAGPGPLPRLVRRAGVIPLWLDAEATRPNVARAWLDRLAERYGREISAPELMAYCYAVLSAPSYTRRFAEELRTPGPRVPLPLEAASFQRGVTLGQELLAIHTYQRVTPGAARLLRETGKGLPLDFGYETATDSLWLGDGRIGPVSDEVWAYSVSGYRVVNGWLRRRLRRRGKSPLDAIDPARWDATLTREFLELLWLVEADVRRRTALDALLDDVTVQAVSNAESVKPAGITDAPRN